MKWSVRIAAWLLSTNLSVEERNALTNAILDRQYALPFHDIITIGQDGKALIKGEPLDYQRALLMQQSAKATLDSPVRQLIREQVAFQAVTIGVHKQKVPEDIIFSKAALWWGQREQELLEILAQV